MTKLSESIFERRDNKLSSMVEAIQGWETALASPSSPPSGQFGRVVKIQTDGLTLTNALDLEFEIPFGNNPESDEATITIYNLSKTTISRLKLNKEISVTAGYGSDTGVIYSGVISKVKTTWSGQDKITVIKAIDGPKKEEEKDERVVTITFCGASSNRLTIIKTLVGKLGLPVVWPKELDEEEDKILKNPNSKGSVTLTGNLTELIKTQSEAAGLIVYIDKQKVYVTKKKKSEDKTILTVSVDTGLIDSPTEEEKDGEVSGSLTVKMLLEHRVTPAVIIELKSREFKGTYMINEGKHICNESEFITEMKVSEQK